MKKRLPVLLRHRLALMGIPVGIFAGAVAVFYRICLGYCEQAREGILAFFGQNGWTMLVWGAILVVLAWIVSFCLKQEPMISGSGIPQVEGEIHEHFDPCPLKVLVYKIIGGCLSIVGGLSLGREGPSIQLGAMSGKFLSCCMKRDSEEKSFLLTCGASAGLAAAFNAPLAGVLFAIEEIHKKVSVTLLFSVMVSVTVADYLSKLVFGVAPVFHFPLTSAIPLKHYWVLLLLGVLVGVLGTVYNKVLLATQKLYCRIPSVFVRVLIPFMIAGVLGFMLPQVLGGGHSMIELLTETKPMLSMILLLFLMKFLFSMLSFGSGAPGGIFFPLLVLGAYVGAAFGSIFVSVCGLEANVLYQFVVLAMAGYFTAIVHAPLTGIVLLCEMTGDFGQMLPLAVVCTVSYLVTDLLKNQPIYDSLLERMLPDKK